jgi:DNA (cytosine-5)-methyltransferase 1
MEGARNQEPRTNKRGGGMNHASLFSGIGGFDLAAEWMGWTNIFNCEWEEFPQRILKHHFPNAKQYGDIKELDATAYAGRVDILTGGFPCQPYSLAGKRKGKDDERHLWPEMLRVIRECSPRWVVGENVRGLVGWNGGMVFEEVCADLEACGYSVQPFILPAAGVGAPHRRDRVWFVAYADSIGQQRGKVGKQTQERPQPSDKFFEGWDRLQNADNFYNMAEPPLCGRNDGISKELDGITFSKWRRESIKAYGNAIVPQVALQIFEAIQTYEHGKTIQGGVD